MFGISLNHFTISIFQRSLIAKMCTWCTELNIMVCISYNHYVEATAGELLEVDSGVLSSPGTSVVAWNIPYVILLFKIGWYWRVVVLVSKVAVWVLESISLPFWLFNCFGISSQTRRTVVLCTDLQLHIFLLSLLSNAFSSQIQATIIYIYIYSCDWELSVN